MLLKDVIKVLIIFVIHSFGIIFSVETYLIISRHTFRFVGNTNANNGRCVNIYRVLRRDQSRFIEAPITRANIAFTIMAVCILPSKRAKAPSMDLIKTRIQLSKESYSYSVFVVESSHLV